MLVMESMVNICEKYLALKVVSGTFDIDAFQQANLAHLIGMREIYDGITLTNFCDLILHMIGYFEDIKLASQLFVRKSQDVKKEHYLTMKRLYDDDIPIAVFEYLFGIVYDVETGNQRDIE
eukprot:NODE_259_length_11524_cov_0.251028.p8 type:complete len:121 gc:universal NODE_259_length_11524_cov_0.251028:3895-3533(-)